MLLFGPEFLIGVIAKKLFIILINWHTIQSTPYNDSRSPVVPEVGLEPTVVFRHLILSQAPKPIRILRHIKNIFQPAYASGMVLLPLPSFKLSVKRLLNTRGRNIKRGLPAEVQSLALDTTVICNPVSTFYRQSIQLLFRGNLIPSGIPEI